MIQKVVLTSEAIPRENPMSDAAVQDSIDLFRGRIFTDC